LSEESLIYGIPQSEWDAAYGLDVTEVVATRAVVRRDGDGFVRLAFGCKGAPTNESGGTRPPKFTFGVTLNEHLALEVARIIREIIADDQKASTTQS
jgi:hypothetical protein